MCYNYRLYAITKELHDPENMEHIEQKARCKMKTAIINVNLEFNFEDFQTDEEIMDELMNVDLPSNYVEDSFEFVKIIKSEV